MDYLLDLETLGTPSQAIVLSIALLPITDADANTPFIELVNRAHFWKLDVKDQYARKRTHDESTLEWWNKQSQSAKATSLRPLPTDLHPDQFLDDLRRIVKKGDTFWSRGSMDIVWLQSLTRTYCHYKEPDAQIIDESQYLDIRTMLLCQGKSVNHKTRPVEFIPHDPRHDCAIDALALLSPAPEEVTAQAA